MLIVHNVKLRIRGPHSQKAKGGGGMGLESKSRRLLDGILYEL